MTAMTAMTAMTVPARAVFFLCFFHRGDILSPQWKLSFILIVATDHNARPEGGFYDPTFLSYLWQV